MENKKFLNEISHNVCMQRYNMDIFHSWSEFQRQGLTTWKQASVLILLLVDAYMLVVTVYSTGMLSKLFVLPYQES